MFSKTDISQRRSSYEIVADILRIARKGARKTRIVYGANLNFKILEEYMIKLKEARFVTVTEGKIKTTEQGNVFLEKFNRLRQFGA